MRVCSLPDGDAELAASGQGGRRRVRADERGAPPSATSCLQRRARRHRHVHPDASREPRTRRPVRRRARATTWRIKWRSSTATWRGATSSCVRQRAATRLLARRPVPRRPCESRHLRRRPRPAEAHRRCALRSGGRRRRRPTPVLRRHFPAIGADDPVVVWGGGVYDWFDPLSLVRAVDQLRKSVPDIRLVFLGMTNPNPGHRRDGPGRRVAGLERRARSDRSPRLLQRRVGALRRLGRLPARRRCGGVHASRQRSRRATRSAPACSTTCGHADPWCSPPATP